MPRSAFQQLEEDDEVIDKSVFEQLKEDDELIEVPMNDIGIFDPMIEYSKETGQKKALGTRYLNGCTTIVAIAHGGAMLHAAPFGDTGEPQRGVLASTGQMHLGALLRKMIHAMEDRPIIFPTGTTYWGVFARDKDGNTMDHIIETADTMIKSWGGHLNQTFYDVTLPSQRPTRPGKGEVVLVVPKYGWPKLFVEDVHQKTGPRASIPGPSKASSSAVAGNLRTLAGKSPSAYGQPQTYKQSVPASTASSSTVASSLMTSAGKIPPRYSQSMSAPWSSVAPTSGNKLPTSTYQVDASKISYSRIGTRDGSQLSTRPTTVPGRSIATSVRTMPSANSPIAMTLSTNGYTISVEGSQDYLQCKYGNQVVKLPVSGEAPVFLIYLRGGWVTASLHEGRVWVNVDGTPIRLEKI